MFLVPLLLVATDGRESSAGAVRLARRLAETNNSDVELVTVGGSGSGRRVRSLLDNVFTSPPTWTHTVMPGDVGPALSRMTTERTASLLLIGMKADSERRSALEFALSARIPVLAVPRHMSEPPHRALLALDFSQCSVQAARAAFTILSRPARAFMVSVGATPIGEDPEPYIGLLFDTVEDVLTGADGVAITRQSVAGDAAAALLRVAASQSVDLISVGRCGRSATTCATPRAMGRVARAILASASCGVLIAPAPHVVQ